MRFRRVWAISRKEFIQVVRDPRSLGMAIAIPMLLLILFGYALTLDVDNVPIVIWDQSETPESRDLISRFGGSRYFSIRPSARNYRELELAINSGEALCALVVPVDFARHVRTHRPAPVQLILDGSDSNTATIARGYAEAVVQAYSTEVLLGETAMAASAKHSSPLEVRPRVCTNTHCSALLSHGEHRPYPAGPCPCLLHSLPCSGYRRTVEPTVSELVRTVCIVSTHAGRYIED